MDTPQLSKVLSSLHSVFSTCKVYVACVGINCSRHLSRIPRTENRIYTIRISTSSFVSAKGSFSLLFSLISATAAIGVFCQIGELKSLLVRFPFVEEESLSAQELSS